MCDSYFPFIVTLVFGSVYCFEYYQLDLPNGNKVKNPCDQDGVWSGVGHYGPKGSGPKNQFGIDFALAGRVSIRIMLFFWKHVQQKLYVINKLYSYFYYLFLFVLNFNTNVKPCSHFG